MPELQDLIPSIWLSLSIKSSVRFRSVSKSWCASLSDPQFIYKNLTADNEHDLLLMADLEHHHYSIESSDQTAPLQVSPPNFPVLHRGHGYDALSPICDDMVCFHVHGYDVVPSMGVWNLTTGETTMVPLLVIDEDAPPPDPATFGFGFDEKRKEYKIVQIVSLGQGDFAGYVYSLNSSSNNGWRKVGEPKMLYSFVGCSYTYSRSYKDGTFYWGLHHLIMCFDMSTEVFNPISVSPLHVGIQNICMLKEGSMLMIVTMTPKGSWFSKYEMWALLDVGVEQSWTKLSVIEWGPSGDDFPFGFWRDKLILRSKVQRRLHIRDPFKREFRKIHIDKPYEISKCLVWTKKGRSVLH